MLEEKTSFEYNLLATITLKRWNNAINRFDIEKIYIRSEAMTVTNKRWPGEGSGWIVEIIDDIHIFISNYDPLSGSSYIPLPPELNNSMKRLINLKNNDIECFKWFHIRFINPQTKYFDRINKQDKKITSTLDYRGINFPMKARDYEIV